MKKLLIFFFASVASIVLFFAILHNHNKTVAQKQQYKEYFNIAFDKEKQHSNMRPPIDFRKGRVATSEAELNWDLPELEIRLPSDTPKQYGQISGFRIFRDGVWYKDVGQLNIKFTDIGLLPNQEYTYQIATLNFDNKIQGRKSKIVKINTKTGNSKSPINFTKEKVESILVLGNNLIPQNTPKPIAWTELTRTLLENEIGTFRFTDFTNDINKTGDLTASLEKNLEQSRPDLVLIFTGIKDFTGSSREIGYISLHDYKSELNKIIDIIKPGPERLVLLLNLSPISEYQFEYHRKSWNKSLSEIASEKQIHLVDISAPLTSLPELIRNADIVNLNQKGHDIIAEKVFEKITEILSK